MIEDREELRQIERSLDVFIEKHGEQYRYVIIRPSGVEENGIKYKVENSNRVSILPSGKNVPIDKALEALDHWIKMGQADMAEGKRINAERSSKKNPYPPKG
jgi:hypothetical protein